MKIWPYCWNTCGMLVDVRLGNDIIVQTYHDLEKKIHKTMSAFHRASNYLPFLYLLDQMKKNWDTTYGLPRWVPYLFRARDDLRLFSKIEIFFLAPYTHVGIVWIMNNTAGKYFDVLAECHILSEKKVHTKFFWNSVVNEADVLHFSFQTRNKKRNKTREKIKKKFVEVSSFWSERRIARIFSQCTCARIHKYRISGVKKVWKAKRCRRVFYLKKSSVIIFLT